MKNMGQQQKKVFGCNEFFKGTFEVINVLRNEKKLCDVVLQVEKKEFHVHKIVLAGISPYLRAMFTNGMSESEKKNIDIHGIDQGTMEILLNYCYTGTIEINTENVGQILAGSSLLNIDQLRKACAKFLREQMDHSNCIGIQNLANVYSLGNLQSIAEDYINQNFLEVRNTDEFLQLDFEILLKLLKSDSIKVRSEEDVFSALERWLYYNYENRKSFSSELLNCIRFPLLSLEFLEYKVFVAPFVKSSTKSQLLLARVMNEQPEKLPNYLCTPRALPQSIYAMGGRNSSSCQLDIVERYDIYEDRWYCEINLNIARTAVGSASLDEYLYAVGGECAINEPHDDTLYLSSVECYNPCLKLWFPVADIAAARSFVSVVVCSGYLYALGGEDRNASFNIVEKFYPKLNRWRLVQPMKKRRAGAGATEHEGYIYIAGGYDRGVHCDRASVECYCPIKNVWTFVGELEKARSGLNLVSLGSVIYAIGGRNRSNDQYFPTCEKYNPSTMQWLSVSTLFSPRAWAGAAILKNKIFVVGGFDGVNRLTSVEMYNPEDDSWEQVSNMNCARAGCGVAVL